MDTLGRRVKVTNVDGEQWSGEAQRLGGNGSLIVQEDEGREREVFAADIEHLYQ
jgi:biotin-(acetyl-CoA carboxylase) ligase